jgi:hypothetical protein
MPVSEQEAVSACILARQNGWAEVIPIDLTSPDLGAYSATESDYYSRIEGAFAGNLFAETVQAWACDAWDGDAAHYTAEGWNRRSCRLTAGGYADIAGDCGVIATDDSCDAGGLLGCAWDAAGFYRDCEVIATDPVTYQTVQRTYSRPITVYIHPRAAGEACRYDRQCESWICLAQDASSGRCATSLLQNGATCLTSRDCQAAECVDGSCGRPTGSYCSTGSQCASGVCARKTSTCQ